MEQLAISSTSPLDAAIPAGYLSNAGRQRYLLEAESSTGFVAWRIADGTTLISNAQQVSLAASEFVWFWSCAGWQDTTPAGHILSFDCHSNELVYLDVRRLTGLEYLDGSFNRLHALPLDGLVELEALDADHNELAMLQVRHLRALRVLNCAGNRMEQLDVSGLTRLEVLDCSRNANIAMRRERCDSLRKVTMCEDSVP